MNIKSFMDRMIGKWVSQNTYYIPLANSINNSPKTLTNQVKWSHINSDEIPMDILQKRLKQEKIDNKVYLYKVESENNNVGKCYIALLKNKDNITSLIKLNQEFQKVNSFIITKISKNHLCLVSKMHKITIIEKIYFLSTNVKLITSITKTSGKCIVTAFSSEIKIT